MTFRDAETAFNGAIAAGRLSDNPKARNYAGNYMYMGTLHNDDMFKNVKTRQYLGSSLHASALVMPDTLR